MKAVSSAARNWLNDIGIYAGRVRDFSRSDWLVYMAWVGLISGLFLSVTGFILLGWKAGAPFPAYVWNIPIGTAIFVGAIAFDTIGHRTVYREALEQGERLVHHITIFAGITSVVALCLAYEHREFMRIPALVLIVLSFVYSLIDEALHWHRYLTRKSDRVEMWSHFFIFLGHLIMIIAWWQWFDEGYAGVAETLAAMKGAS